MEIVWFVGVRVYRVVLELHKHHKMANATPPKTKTPPNCDTWESESLEFCSTQRTRPQLSLFRIFIYTATSLSSSVNGARSCFRNFEFSNKCVGQTALFWCKSDTLQVRKFFKKYFCFVPYFLSFIGNLHSKYSESSWNKLNVPITIGLRLDILDPGRKNFTFDLSSCRYRFFVRSRGQCLEIDKQVAWLTVNDE